MDRNNIIKFLKGKSDKTETVQIHDWLADPSNEKLTRESLGDVWANHSINLKNNKPDFDKILSNVHHKINLNQPSAKQAGPEKNTMKRAIPLFYRIAAILIIPLFLSSLLLFFSGNPLRNDQVAVVERQVYTKPGTITQFELPDGSKVWLNDGTTLKYPEKFTGNERRLFVDGEAYFEVKTDPKHPFIVENPMMNTLVTGTSFNINAYSNDKYFEITLVEGKVQLEKNNQQFDLKPGEQIRFDVAKTQINRKNVNPAIYASWINGRLILEDEPLGVAVKKLGRWYNVDFIIADNELFALLLTATFQDEKLEQTLQNIVFALPVKFSIKEELVNNSPHKTIYLMKR
jgi:ferric-dicitrate binding protein FerR (iron transport regulator)